MDQGELGSCTVHGITGALRYLIVKSGKPDVPLARLQLYYDERQVEGTINDDAGAEIRDGIKCVVSNGVAHENLWPYDVKTFTAQPTPTVYLDAHRFEALTYERVRIASADLKNCLARGFPVIIGISLFESFESDGTAQSGMISMPDIKNEEIVGGHCMYCVGYGQKPNTFTVRNSWGVDWGDKGDCYFPEKYIGSSLFGSDYWIIKTTT